MTGMAALAICAAFTSCSKDTDVYNPNQKAEDVKLTYDQAFVKVFGQPAADQDWGFGNYAKSSTRADGDPEVVKKDVWQNFPDKLDGNAVPADVTTAEAAYVYEWFQKEENKGLTEEGQPWTDFFIQQVYGTMDKQKKGIWHRHDINPQPNGRDWDEEFTDKGGMDYLTVGDGTTMTHVLDFNAEKGGPWGIVYMKNSSAMQFGYHGSWDSSDRQLFKLAQITVPGECFGEGEADRTAWYVGLSLLAEKDDNGKKVLGEQRKDWGDDWILKVVPGKSKVEEPDYTIRVIGEDLTFGEDLDTDFDFNDVVFDVATNLPKTWIKIKAAGGTLPLIIGVENPDNAQSYDDYEIHHLLGYNNTSVMINTNADLKGLNSGTAGDVEIELSKAYANAKDIPVYVKKEGAWVELKAQQGEPASKLGVDTNFRWCNERSSLKGDYPLFVQWVTTAGAERVKWY